jgi:hypothetical protein
MLHTARIALIQILQARLAEEYEMITKLRDRYILTFPLYERC